MNIEVALVDYLGTHSEIKVPVSADVPANPPDEFITIERTGGGVDTLICDRPTVAIQCWSTSRLGALTLAETVRDVMDGFKYYPSICAVVLNSMYNYPTSHAEPRYQLLYNITMRRDID